MGNEKIYQMEFSKVYHLLVNKAEKKGRTRQEECMRLPEQDAGLFAGQNKAEQQNQIQKQ